MNVELAATALRTALRHDPSLPDEPARLARALTDLLPQDERSVELLVTAARAGVPTLLAGRQGREARNRLADHAGLRGEVAGQIVDAWRAATTAAVPPAAGRPASRADLESERPGAPTAVAAGTGPSGETTIGLVTAAGIFAGAGAVWRRVATPPAPTSRDVAIAGGHVVWSGPGGVFARPLTEASLGEQRLVAAAEQARYPLAAVCPDGESLDVFWAPDRVRIEHHTLRGWQTSSALEVPPAPSGERLNALAAAGSGPRTVWLAALTEAGTVACCRWDLPTAGVGDWTLLNPPVRTVTLTLSGSLLLAGTTGGHLLAYDLAGARTWRSVDPPTATTRPPQAPHAMAATGGELVVAAADGTWTAPVSRTDGVPTLGAARPLEL